MTDRSLVGRRVVVTRAAEQVDGLAGLLADEGAVPVVVPLIEVVDVPEALVALSAVVPSSFDWLVVSSPNGARRWALAHGGSTPPQVAAVGSTTAAVLAEAGAAVTLTPAVQSAEGLLAEFPAGAGTVLVVQAVDAAPTMVEGLTALGWRVTAIAPYRSVAARPTAAQQLAALSADAVLLASGSAARAWAAAFGDAAPPVVVAIGPQTAAAARAVGLLVTAVAADHSLRGLVDELRRQVS